MDETSRKKKLSYFYCFLAAALYWLSFTITVPSFPILFLRLTSNDTNKSAYLYGLISSIRYIVEFVSSPYLGRLSDKFGRKPFFLFAVASLFLEFFVLAMYPSILMIFLTRTLSGILYGYYNYEMLL